MRSDPTPDTRVDLAERVLLAVELIPPGRVASYGDVGGVVGCGPRHVGNVLSRSGAGVPWWRVVNVSGDSPLLDRALPHWRAEGIPLKPNGRGCRIADHRCDLVALAAAFDATIADATAGRGSRPSAR